MKCIHELGKERRTAQTTNDSFPLAASNTAFISGALHGGSKDQGRCHFLRFLEVPWLFYSSRGTGRGRSMHTYLARPRQPNSSESDVRLRTWTWRDAALYIPPFFPYRVLKIAQFRLRFCANTLYIKPEIPSALAIYEMGFLTHTLSLCIPQAKAETKTKAPSLALHRHARVPGPHTSNQNSQTPSPFLKNVLSRVSCPLLRSYGFVGSRGASRRRKEVAACVVVRVAMVVPMGGAGLSGLEPSAGRERRRCVLCFVWSAGD